MSAPGAPSGTNGDNMVVDLPTPAVSQHHRIPVQGIHSNLYCFISDVVAIANKENNAKCDIRINVKLGVINNIKDNRLPTPTPFLLQIFDRNKEG